MNEFEKAQLKYKQRLERDARQAATRTQSSEQKEVIAEKKANNPETVEILVNTKGKLICLSYEVKNICDGIPEHKINEAGFNQIFLPLLVSSFGAKVCHRS